MKAIVFAKRNFKEIARDPLSYVFCAALPVVMLLVFQVINHYSPEAAWFKIDTLAPGIIIFSYSFVMLFMSLLVSKDRKSLFLRRLFISPLSNVDFIIGYMIPGIIIAVLQTIICCIASAAIALCTDVQLNIAGMLLSLVVNLPIILGFVFLGIIFGGLFSENAAPGITSTIITLSGFVSGAWMPLESMGNFADICMFMPFYPAVKLCRAAFKLEAPSFDAYWKNLLIVAAYTIVIFVLAVVVFKTKTRKENG